MKSTNEIMSDWLKETSQPLNTPASRAFWRVLLLRDRYSEELQTSLAHDKQSKDKFSKLVRKANEMIARFDKNLSSLTKAVKPIPQHVPADQATQVPRAETTTQPLNHAPAEATPKGSGGNTTEKKPTPVDEFLAELINKHGEGIKQLRDALLDSHDRNRRYRFDGEILTLIGMNVDGLPLTARQFTLSSGNLSDRKKKLKSLGLIE